MHGVGRVVRSELAGRLGSLAGLALVVTLGLGATLGAFIVAHRTDRAYPEHAAAANVADLVVNPSLASADADRVLRGLPHVRRVTTSDLMFAGIVDSEIRTVGEALAQQDPGVIRGSVDGRFSRSDRLIVEHGRAPTGHREVFVTEPYRRALGRLLGHRVELGDRIPIVFLWAGAEVAAQWDPDTSLRPIGTEHLRVSGFGRLADAVLDDPVFPRQDLIVSADVVRRHTCPSRIIASEDRDVVLRGLVPETCSLSYRYFALDVDDPANVPAVKRAARQELSALNRRLPEQWQAIEDGPAYYPVITTRREAEEAVQRSVRPTVVALRLFGGVTALASLAVVLLGAARIVRSGKVTDGVVRALGMGRTGRTLVLGLPPAVGVLVGAIGAIGVGVLLSPIGPVGDVARVRPDRTFAAPGAPVIPTILGGALVLTLGIGIIALLATRRRIDHHPRAGRTARRLVAGTPPDIADGVAAAFTSGRSSLLPIASTIAIGAIAAATVFGANVGALVGDSHRYGWPWQIGVLTGFGYGETDRALVEKTLGGRSQVAARDELGFASGAVGQSPVAVLYGARAPDLAVVSGRPARRVGEATIGRATADQLDIQVGDRIQLTVRDGSRPVRVVGITVMPALGQYESDRAGLGVGVFTILPQRQMDDHAVTFVGIHLRAGADPTRTLSSMQSQVVQWDQTGSAPYTYVTPVRPAEIVNADAARGTPMLLAGVLAIALLAALALSLGASVNARRRDYAVLRAIGFTSKQVARAVRWHGLAALGAGIVFGIPLGIVVGRWLWGQFAEVLGVSPDPTVPAAALLVLAVLAPLGALVAAIGPARRAMRAHPAEILRAP